MSTATRVGLVILVLVLIAAGVLAFLVLDRPRVEDVQNEWGTVTQERTEIRSRVTVRNARLLRLGDSVADLEYTVTMNDVVVAREEKENVDLSGRENVVELSTWVRNDAIPEWWVSHIRNDETTVVEVRPVVIPETVGVRYSPNSMTRNRTVETNLLEPLRTSEATDVEAAGRTVLVVEGTDARWGEVNASATPIVASATVRNPTRFPIPLTRLRYSIRMNGVPVGNGTAGSPGPIQPRATKEITARAVIDTSRLDEWWVTHRRRNGTTRMTVNVTAVVELPGEGRLELPFLSYSRTFETDLLGEDDGSDADNGAVPSRSPVVPRPGAGPVAGPTAAGAAWG